MNFKQLEKENDLIRSKINKLLSEYMMSEEVLSTEILINKLVENEIEQEGFCNG